MLQTMAEVGFYVFTGAVAEVPLPLHPSLSRRRASGVWAPWGQAEVATLRADFEHVLHRNSPRVKAVPQEWFDYQGGTRAAPASRFSAGPVHC